MKQALFVVTAVLLSGVPELAAQDTAGAVERRSGIIEIDGTLEPYLLEGRGVPCVVVGPAFFYAQFFSDNLKQHIQFVLVDAKNTWMADESVDLSDVTMADLVDEIDEVRQAFGYEKICVLGCSALGLWSLEYALAYPDHTSHAILIGTPPPLDKDIEPIQDEFIATDASEERQARWSENRERVPEGLRERLSRWDWFVYTFVKNAPLYWFDYTYDPFRHFAGRQDYSAMKERVFSVLLTDYDPRDQFSSIEAPVFLALGRHDYVVPHFLWDNDRRRIRNLSYHVFERSGHFPMLEEQALFDEKLIEFIERWKP